jgi:hypothetical protein
MGIAYTDLILEIGEEGQIDSKKETGRTVREIWDYETVKPCNLLGPTAGYWLKKILATSIEWKAFRGTLHAWHREKESNFERRKVYLQEVLYTWEEVRVAFHVACEKSNSLHSLASSEEDEAQWAGRGYEL